MSSNCTYTKPFPLQCSSQVSISPTPPPKHSPFTITPNPPVNLRNSMMSQVSPLTLRPWLERYGLVNDL